MAKVTAAGGEATPGAAPEQVDCDPLAAEFFRRLPDDLGAIEAALLSGDTGDARQQLHKLYGGAVFFAGEAFIGILEDVREATRDDDIDGALGKLATLRPASRLPEALSA